MSQLIMRWENDKKPADDIILEEGFSIARFPEVENAVEKWLDLVQYGLSEKREDEEYYKKAMYSYENYDEKNCFFIVHNNVTPAATITVICNHETKEGYVHMVCCRESFRGHGLGRALSELCVKVLKEEKMETAYLTTDDWRIPAICCYLKSGFVPDLSTEDYKIRWEKVMNEIRK